MSKAAQDVKKVMDRVFEDRLFLTDEAIHLAMLPGFVQLILERLDAIEIATMHVWRGQK